MAEGLWVQEPGLTCGCGTATPMGWHQVSVLPCPDKGKEKQGRPFPSVIWWFDTGAILNFMPVSVFFQQRKLKRHVFAFPNRVAGWGRREQQVGVSLLRASGTKECL